MRALGFFGLVSLASCSGGVEIETELATTLELESAALEPREALGADADEWTWSWYTAAPERRVFTLGALDRPQLEPLGHDVRFAPLSDTEGVVAVGPIGEWYAHDTYYVHITLDGPRVLGVANYVHSDVSVHCGWTEPCGQVAIEARGATRLRLGLALTSDEGEPWITGLIDASTAEDSETLRAELATPGLPFAAD